MRINMNKLLSSFIMILSLLTFSTVTLADRHHHGHHRDGLNVQLNLGPGGYYPNNYYPNNYYPNNYWRDSYVRCRWVPGYWDRYGYRVPGHRACWRYGY